MMPLPVLFVLLAIFSLTSAVYATVYDRDRDAAFAFVMMAVLLLVLAVATT